MNGIPDFPEPLVARLKETHSQKDFDRIMHAFQTPRLTTLRVNSIRSSGAALENVFMRKGLNFRKVTWYNDAFIMPDTSAKSLAQLPEYGNGSFYIQNLSSMIPPLVLDPQKGDRILDITAAPGSKTTQIAAIMGNGGLIVANDKSPIRRLKLKANIGIQGVTNTLITGYPAQIIWKKYPEYFDRVLADVPCSMEGMIQTHIPKTYQSWSSRKVRELSETQKAIIRSSVSSTKPGGIIVYSTCTLSVEENEKIIDWILKKEKGAIRLERISFSCPDQTPGIRQWKSQSFEEIADRVIRILPSDATEGFFVAKIRKTKSTVPVNMRISGEANFSQSA